MSTKKIKNSVYSYEISRPRSICRSGFPEGNSSAVHKLPPGSEGEAGWPQGATFLKPPVHCGAWQGGKRSKSQARFGGLSRSRSTGRSKKSCSGTPLRIRPKSRMARRERIKPGHIGITPGSVLPSRTVSREVLSALWVLTTEFGMGSGGTPTLWPPGSF
jgi:hypothetical protein